MYVIEVDVLVVLFDDVICFVEVCLVFMKWFVDFFLEVLVYFKIVEVVVCVVVIGKLFGFMVIGVGEVKDYVVKVKVNGLILVFSDDW